MGTPSESLNHAPSNLAEARALRDEFKRQHDAGDHPHHPVLRLGNALCEQIHGPLANSNDKKLLSELEVDAEETNTEFWANYLGNCDYDTLAPILENAIRARTRNAFDGSLRPIDDVAAEIDDIVRSVLTGHPTFRDTPEHDQAMSNVIAFKAGAKNYGPETLDELAKTRETPFTPPNTKVEWSQIQAKLQNLDTARKWARDIAMKVMREEYPQEWTKVNYAIHSIGSWMFYDWDGRKDIKWNMTMENRILLQQLRLEDYIPQLRELSALLDGDDREAVDFLADKFTNTNKITEQHKHFFSTYNQEEDNGLAKLREQSEKIILDKPQRVTNPREAIALMQRIIDTTGNEDVKFRAMQLRSDLVSQGISFAEPHFRISSTSVHQALREGIDDDSQKIDIRDNDATDKIYHAKIEKMIADTRTKNSNLLDVAQSDVTVFTQMALARQFVTKYDDYCPIRYLVAETHSATTIKAALYVAKLVGVQDHINISPLIEDEAGSRKARGFMRLLYESPAYLEHVAGPRPHNPAQRVATVELGYSDFAIDVNQIPAGAFHEQMIGQIVQLHARALKGKDVKLLIYHTGGHFMGRGFHPGSIRDSQQYFNSRFFLNKAREEGVQLILERSFQGGSGQTILGTPETCFAEIVRSAAYFLEDHGVNHDPYYGTARTSALAFVEQVKASHFEMSSSTGYKQMTAIFQQLIAGSGSRPTVAQFDGNTKRAPKLRAIRGNGSNAQTGYLTNILHGVGQAIENDPESFDVLARNSEFFRNTRLGMIVRALDISDPGIRRSYIELYNPAFWIERARTRHTAEERAVCNNVASYLEKFGVYKDFKSVVDSQAMDYQRTRQHFESTGLMDHPDFQKPTIRVSPSQQANMEIAHGLRISKMIQLFELAAQIPEIAGRHDIPRETLVERIMCFDPKGIEILEKVFHQKDNGHVIDFPLEPSEFGRAAGYRNFAQEFTVPMRECLETNHRVGAIIADYVGGVG